LDSEVPQPRQIRLETKEPLLDISSSHFFLPLRASARLSPDPWMIKRVFSIYEALQRHLRVVDGIAIGHNIKPRQESIVARDARKVTRFVLFRKEEKL
jgi:hypothetical protein